MSHEIEAIPTDWRGTVFRSRTEARWAVFFDAIRLKWEYEPEGFKLEDGTWYLPDFWLPGLEHSGCWAEVKPDWVQPEARGRVEMLVSGTGHPAVILNGSPRYQAFRYCWPDNTPSGAAWTDALFDDQYTACRRDGYPRLFVSTGGHVPDGWDTLIERAMSFARRVSLREPTAGEYMPLGWAAIDPVTDDPAIDEFAVVDDDFQATDEASAA